ncbi:MAG: toprim domain-containing protein [Thermoplasmata archaeon]
MAPPDAPIRRFEAFLQFWARFGLEARRPGTVILVEGERDRAALRRLGIDGDVQTLHAGRTLADRIQELADRHGRVIVLTDWDRQGGRLARRLEEYGRGGRPSIDLLARRELAGLLRNEVVHVEGLATWAIRQAETFHRSLEEEFRACGWETVVPTG